MAWFFLDYSSHDWILFKKKFEYFLFFYRCYTYEDGSVFVSEHQMLSLLDVCNIVNQMKKTSVEPIAMFFIIELLHILEKLQKSNIIHGDIKPDNFLVNILAF